MKIGIDLRSLQERERAGIGHYVWHLCKSLIRLDGENEYYFYFNTSKRIKYPEFTKQGTIVHSRIPSRIFNLCSRFLRWPAWDRRQELDLFWQPSFNFIHLSKRVVKVLTVHDLSWMINRRWYSRKMLLWHRLQNIAKVVQSTDSIVAVSASTKADIQYFFKIPKKKIKVIYSGINKGGHAEQSDLIAKLPAKFFLFVGTIEPRKNVHGILQAWEKIYDEHPEHHDVHFVIMGARGWRNRKIWRLINQSKYSDKFHYIGYTSNKARDFCIKKSQGLIWPSFYEGFGHPPLESLWRGKPVILGHGSSLPEVVKLSAILVDPYNISDLATAILEMIKRPMPVVNAREALVDYDWDRTAQAYLNIFNSYRKQ